MATNRYYTNPNDSNTISPGDSAEAADVENKCDDIATGLDQVELEMDQRMSLSNADNTNYDIPDALGVRANKMLGFDSSGGFGLQVRRGTFKGDWTTATYYYQDDMVRDVGDVLGYGNDAIVVANVNHTASGSLATDTANWVLVFIGDLLDRATADTIYLDKFGDVSLEGTFIIKAVDAISEPSITFRDNSNVRRFKLETDSNNEEITLTNYDNSGVEVGTLTIEADGNVRVDGTTPTGNNHLVTKGYSDNKFYSKLLNDITVGLEFDPTDWSININQNSNGMDIDVKNAGITQKTLRLDADGATCEELHATNGFTGTVANPTSITVVDGIITAMS